MNGNTELYFVVGGHHLGDVDVTVALLRDTPGAPPECLVTPQSGDGTARIDLGTPEGRRSIERLRQNLADALAAHDVAVERLYGTLKPGDVVDTTGWPTGRGRCDYAMADGQLLWSCSRPAHVDGHHVAVDPDGVVYFAEHAGPAPVALPPVQPMDSRLEDLVVQWCLRAAELADVGDAGGSGQVHPGCAAAVLQQAARELADVATPLVPSVVPHATR